MHVESLLPAPGRIAVRHLRIKPTSVEVELLDPVGDLVGEAARIRFVRRLRDRDDEAGAAREPETRTSADRDAARAVLA